MTSLAQKSREIGNLSFDLVQLFTFGDIEIVATVNKKNRTNAMESAVARYTEYADLRQEQEQFYQKEQDARHAQVLRSMKLNFLPDSNDFSVRNRKQAQLDELKSQICMSTCPIYLSLFLTHVV
jgi:hypothetical protein